MQKYEKYKDSGITWLGRIPQNWEILRMKFLFKDVSVKNQPEMELLSVTQDQGVVPRTMVESRMVMPSGNLESFKVIAKGDFAISLRSFEGGLEYSNYDGIISPAYTVLKSQKKIHNPYFKFLFKSRVFIGELQLSVVGIREGKNISYEELKYSYISLPPLFEQQAIATFLEDKTSKIDQTISLKQKEIALLKERRQILIQKAVTKGLNDQVKMKDSGVDWIGEIPEHWKVRKLKSISKIVNGATPSSSEPTYWDGEIIWVTPKDINNIEIITDSERKISAKGFESCGTTIVPEGSIVMTTRAPIGKVTIAGTNLCTNQGCKSIVINQNALLNKFLYYQIIINSELLNSLGSGTTFMELSNRELKNFSISLPPFIEQLEIVRILGEIETKISNAISIKQQEIEKLKEYKTVLIDNVVTGKVKVVA